MFMLRRLAGRQARQPATVAAAATAAAAAATAIVLGGEHAGPAAQCLPRTANQTLAPRHRVSIVAGVLRNASWEADPRLRDLGSMLQHLKSAGYDGTETSVGDLIMMFYQDKSPEEAIPLICAAYSRAGTRSRALCLGGPRPSP